MLIETCPQALNRVNDKRMISKVRSPIRVHNMPHSGLGKLLTFTGFSSELTYFTCDRSAYNCIKISSLILSYPVIYGLFGDR